LKHFDRVMTKQLATLANTFPGKVRALHLCTGPGRSVVGLLLLILKQIWGREMRLRALLRCPPPICRLRSERKTRPSRVWTIFRESLKCTRLDPRAKEVRERFCLQSITPRYGLFIQQPSFSPWQALLQMHHTWVKCKSTFLEVLSSVYRHFSYSSWCAINTCL
jgi:hypothetical protein